MPAPQTTRQAVIAILMDVFRTYGYDGASLAQLSKATRLGKSSLYHYFPGGKEDMVLAVLEQVGQWMSDNILKPLAEEGPPKRRLDRMIQALNSLYDQGENACILAALVTGCSRQLFQAQLQAAFNAWISGLERLALDAGLSRLEAAERAEIAVQLIEGALILTGGLNDPSVFQRAMRRLPAQLLE